MEEYILAPSLLSANFMHLGEDIAAVVAGGARYIHFDVMDGSFVPNISFGLPVLSSVRRETDAVLDVHLMIDQPERYVPDFLDAGADILTVHYEATKELPGILETVHAAGKKAGIAVKPKTPVKVLSPYLPLVDMVLVMSVEPGFGGQAFMTESLEKLAWLRREAENAGYAYRLSVDGGINKDTAFLAVAAGANVLVAGSAVFGGDIRQRTQQLLRVIRQSAEKRIEQ